MEGESTFDFGCDMYQSPMEVLTLDAPIVIQDAIMGTGKSSAMIKRFNELAERGKQHDEPYLVVLPYLDEIKRYQQACPGMNFQEPLDDRERSKRGKQGQIVRGDNGATNKTDDLKILLSNGYNILTTHSLFEQWNEEVALLIRDGGYHIIIDEVIGCIEPLRLKLRDGERQDLLRLGYLSIDPDTNRASWNFDKSDKDGRYTGYDKYQKIRNYCKLGSLYIYGNLENAKSLFYVWTIPPGFFGVAKSYTILTYRFEHSEMAAFFKINKIQYRIEKPDVARQQEIAEKAKGLITFVDAPRGVIADTDSKYSLSKSWYDNATPETLKKMRNSIGESLRSTHKVSREEVMWTCPSSYKDAYEKGKGKHIGIKGYSRSKKEGPTQHVPWNCKGTNDYADRSFIVYICNVCFHPGLPKYLSKQGMMIDEGEYALSSLLQFIWRSSIRKGEPIKVMIPNPKMRSLLEDWIASI